MNHDLQLLRDARFSNFKEKRTLDDVCLKIYRTNCNVKLPEMCDKYVGVWKLFISPCFEEGEEFITVKSGENWCIDLDLKIGIPVGFVGLISGSFNNDLKIKTMIWYPEDRLRNLEVEVYNDTDIMLTISPFMCIGQMVLVKYWHHDQDLIEVCNEEFL
jgi:dUTPase